MLITDMPDRISSKTVNMVLLTIATGGGLTHYFGLAGYTLQIGRVNAFDTASLLRASGTPARNVYGTIEVPIAQVMVCSQSCLSLSLAKKPEVAPGFRTVC